MLDKKAARFENPEFIPADPISIPHLFSKKQDIEISGLWIALLSWGNRTTILNKGKELMSIMDYAPHDFVLNHSKKDLKALSHFKHRTFNATDALYFVDFFKRWYSQNDSLENAFSKHLKRTDPHCGPALEGFSAEFCSPEHFPRRTQKHMASPARGSSCKRLNMFLRWMVRSSRKGVDFGLWTSIKSSQLLCPLDVHVFRVAERLGLISRKASDWKTVLELSENLKELSPRDPVKYDFALFGMGVLEK
jgi:uncharacterized protein (TIGR02757 family)